MEPKLLKMKWKKAFFAHWDWDPSDVEARLPKGLQLDTFNGRAYLGVVPFLMEDIRLAVMPSGTGLAFPELNLRTYVTLNGEKGVYFFNLDASSALGVYLARKLFAIPYYQADFSVSTAQESIQFAHKRKIRLQDLMLSTKEINRFFMRKRKPGTLADRTIYFLYEPGQKRLI
ncbi:YqjF family protein [Sinobaca sp. H24]|uniref:YqjF family protein n=1 Tax=Sinobaca sp. H24 TaxID=2923376 RepID=UPI00207AD371|nr:DUF2071 domain-containing protein [Sinobaca sp. H24]